MRVRSKRVVKGSTSATSWCGRWSMSISVAAASVTTNHILAHQFKSLRFKAFKGAVIDKDPPSDPMDKDRHLIDCVNYISSTIRGSSTREEACRKRRAELVNRMPECESLKTVDRGGSRSIISESSSLL